MSEIDLNSPEFKDALSAAVAEATEGLKAKNTELLGKLKKAQQGQQIDPADLAAAESERDEWKAKATEATKAAAKAAKDLDAAVKDREAIDAAYANSLRDQQLTEALAKAGVTDPTYLKAAKALVGASASVVDENGQRVVKVGEKSLADHITEWAGSDEGKRFVAAPDMNGSGSQGGFRNNAGAKSIKRSEFNALDPVARASHFKDGGIVVD